MIENGELKRRVTEEGLTGRYGQSRDFQRRADEQRRLRRADPRSVRGSTRITSTRRSSSPTSAMRVTSCARFMIEPRGETDS